MLLFEPVWVLAVGSLAAAVSLMCLVRRVPKDPYRI